MPISLSNLFDQELMPAVRDFVAGLGLELVLCNSITATEDDYGDDTYFPTPGMSPVSVGSWSSPAQEGDFWVTNAGPVFVENTSPSTDVNTYGFILRIPGEEDVYAWHLFPTAPILVPAGGQIAVNLKLRLSDKLTPEA